MSEFTFITKEQFLADNGNRLAKYDTEVTDFAELTEHGFEFNVKAPIKKR